MPAFGLAFFFPTDPDPESGSTHQRLPYTPSIPPSAANHDIVYMK